MASKIKDNEMIVNTTDGEMKVCVMDITPKRAGELLNRNVNNRNLRINRINLYSSEMMSGNWKSNGIPIIIGTSQQVEVLIIRLITPISSNLILHISV